MVHNNITNRQHQPLPIDGDGLCMLCETKPIEEEQLMCVTCQTPWHVTCLTSVLETAISIVNWSCPDCSATISDLAEPQMNSGDGLLATIRAIEADGSLTEREKAKKRQELLIGKKIDEGDDNDDEKKEKKKNDNDLIYILDKNLNCPFCMQLPDRPITTPCGHNFCLKCFQKWVAQGKRTCAKCRKPIPPNIANQPGINSTLVAIIRKAKMSRSKQPKGVSKVTSFIHNNDRPNEAYTTDQAKRNGNANATSGKIFVIIPSDHFGPIPPENDPDRNRGVLVGDYWKDRLECRQWGVHFPHVAGIAGQLKYGAQSVALSGGYIDDEDHGEWFLYTGRDLGGNKRTNNSQSFDQKFVKLNQALRVSCLKGYPVRVVRSHKEKRSSYAPNEGVRYDGVYRIEMCWRKCILQRCDNEPAPWISNEQGDRPRPLPVIQELKEATDITKRKESASWDFDEENGRWKWKKPPLLHRKLRHTIISEDMSRTTKAIGKVQNSTATNKLLKELNCLKCRQMITFPVTTPCGHNFCKTCLESEFAKKALLRERNIGGQTLRTKKNVIRCPYCPVDISGFLQDIKVNTELMQVIESLKDKVREELAPIEETKEEGKEDTLEDENDIPYTNKGAESSKLDLHAPVITYYRKRKSSDSTQEKREATKKDVGENVYEKNEDEDI